MGRRATGGVYLRGRIWWCHYRVEGERQHESTGETDKRRAMSYLAELRRQIREGTWRPKNERDEPTEPAPITCNEWAETWFERRRDAEVKCAADEERDVRRWLLATHGDSPLVSVTRSDIREAIDGMRRKNGERYAPRTVLKAYAAVRLCFADAVAEEVIASSPCTLQKRRGELPTKRDADPRWRASAVYTRDEAETLISDERIPWDRRVYYSLGLLAGMRAGEINGVQWRDLDTDADPLGRLLVATQAHAATGEELTKTEAVKEVPVHPTLAKILDEWRRNGFALFFGRHPQPGDLIVPSRQDGRSPRSTGMCGALSRDLDRVGLRSEGRSRHAMRSTFLSLLEVDGASMGLVRRATHAAPSDAFGGYLRPPWSAVCREVGKLRVELHKPADVIPIQRAAGDESGYSFGYNPSDEGKKAPKMARIKESRRSQESEKAGGNGGKRRKGASEETPQMPAERSGTEQTVTHCNRSAESERHLATLRRMLANTRARDGERREALAWALRTLGGES